MCYGVVHVQERKLRLMKIGQIFGKREIVGREMLGFTLVNSNVYDAFKANNLTWN